MECTARSARAASPACSTISFQFAACVIEGTARSARAASPACSTISFPSAACVGADTERSARAASPAPPPIMELASVSPLQLHNKQHPHSQLTHHLINRLVNQPAHRLINLISRLIEFLKFLLLCYDHFNLSKINDKQHC